MSYPEQQMQNFIEAGLSEADRCYARITELEQQNAELAAQVEVARKLYVRLTNNVGFSDNGEGCYVADRKLMADFDSWSDATPTQCLREIQAEAVLNAVKFFSPARDVDVEALESYADRVKAGYE